MKLLIGLLRGIVGATVLVTVAALLTGYAIGLVVLAFRAVLG